MILPSVVRSGVTPEPALGPVRPDPERDDLVEDQQGADPVAISRSEPGTPGSAARTPPAPWTGSMMIAATSRSRPASARSTPVRVAPRQLHDEVADRVRDAGVHASTVSCVPW